MISTRFFLLGFLILSCAFIAKAQKAKWFGVETGWVQHNLQDQGLSPLIYKGQSLFFGLSYQNQSDKYYSSISASLVTNQMKPTLSNSTNYDLNTANRNAVFSSYTLLKRSSNSKFNIDYGGSFSVLYDFTSFNHNANNLVSYELSIAVNPTIRIRYDVSDKLKFSITESIPLLSYNIRPMGLGLFPLKNFDVDLGGILIGGSFVTINKLFTIHSRISSEIGIKNKHITLFYDYFGGLNRVSERKAFSFHKVGIQLPLKIQLR